MDASGAPEVELPAVAGDEREMLLAWLAYLRGAVLRKLDGLNEDQVRWRPDGKLISLLGIVNHLTRVEWRWIDGGFRGASVSRSEEEFDPGSELTVPMARAAYRERAAATEAAVRSIPSLEARSARRAERGTDLRWVLLHLINETARHAGHADAVRELLDGARGE
jgi:uncharacterized damage-inducible protein DinB